MAQTLSRRVGYAASVPPSDALDPTLAALDPTERAFVLGSTVLGLGGDGARVLASPSAERCGAALSTMARVPRDQKAARIGQLARELGAPFPPAVDLVHPSWLPKALAAEPSDFLPALALGGPPAVRQAVGEVMQSRQADEEPGTPATLSPELAAELRRVVFATLRHVFATSDGPLAGVLERSGPNMLIEIRRLGARSLGASLAGSPAEVLARAMAVVGSAFAVDLREAAEQVEDRLRREAEADVKAAARDPASTPEERLERIGHQALLRLARHESEEVRRAVALRMPRHLGKQLLTPAVVPEPAKPLRGAGGRP
jgi:hypothetical protein